MAKTIQEIFIIINDRTKKSLIRINNQEPFFIDEPCYRGMKELNEKIRTYPNNDLHSEKAYIAIQSLLLDIEAQQKHVKELISKYKLQVVELSELKKQIKEAEEREREEQDD